jgi:plastocyanin
MVICSKTGARLSALAVLVTGLLFLGCSGPTAAPTGAGAASGAAQGSSTITISDNAFTPQSLTVKAGTAVTWNWASTRNPHSVVGRFGGAAVDSGTHTGSDQFAFTFGAAGTFDYQCGIHGAAMPGKIVVE